MIRKFGWIRQDKDVRDYKLQIQTRIVKALPPLIDLSKNLPAINNQGNLGSCGPNSVDTLIQYDQKIESLPIIQTSRLFTYYNTRAMMNTINEDSGVDNRTLLKSLNKTGYAKENLWPYTISKFKQKPTSAAYKDGLKHVITNYAAVNQTLSQMRGCLVSGFPFLFGFDVFQAIESDAVARTGILPLPKSNETPIGGHDVCIIGYNDATQLFKFRNSWGKWGDNGCGYIPYKYAANVKLAGDFWVINAIPQNLTRVHVLVN